MAFALGFRVIAKARAAMAETAVIDDLYLPAFEKEFAIDSGRLHDLVEGLQRRLPLLIERLLSKQPADRPTPAEVVRALRRCLESRK